MSTKSKLEIISEILEAAELDGTTCRECGLEDTDDLDIVQCHCFAGFVRAKMAEGTDERFFPNDEVCLQMYSEHFGLDELGEQFFNDLMQFVDMWVENNIDDSECDDPECNHGDYQPENTVKPDPKLN